MIFLAFSQLANPTYDILAQTKFVTIATEKSGNMTLDDFKDKLKRTPTSIEFADTMATIEANYHFIPTAFKNGELKNEAGQNSGSCKLFAFAHKEGFSKDETLACFGQYYFEEVLNDINGTGHQNIRNFIKTGFDGLEFEGEALKER